MSLQFIAMKTFLIITFATAVAAFAQTTPMSLMEAAENDAFKTPEIQALLAKNISWFELKSAVRQKAFSERPELKIVPANPMSKLSDEDSKLYKAAIERAGVSPTMKLLRLQQASIGEAIEGLIDELTPGYKAVQKKLQEAATVRR